MPTPKPTSPPRSAAAWMRAVTLVIGTVARRRRQDAVCFSPARASGLVR
jgi:hypothetical protein